MSNTNNKKKTHYVGTSTKHYHEQLLRKFIIRNRLEVLKAVLKIAAGLTIIGPLNSPYGPVVQVTASLIWVAYCGLSYYLAITRKKLDRNQHWIY